MYFLQKVSCVKRSGQYPSTIAYTNQELLRKKFTTHTCNPNMAKNVVNQPFNQEHGIFQRHQEHTPLTKKKRFHDRSFPSTYMWINTPEYNMHVDRKSKYMLSHHT